MPTKFYLLELQAPEGNDLQGLENYLAATIVTELNNGEYQDNREYSVSVTPTTIKKDFRSGFVQGLWLGASIAFFIALLITII